MKKKILFLSYMTVVSAIFGMMFHANAATLLEGTYNDEFANGIDAEKYTVVGDTENKFSFVDKPGQLKFTGFDYANGWIRLANPVEVPEGKSLVVQWEVVSDQRAAGYVVYAKGVSDYASAWADAVHHHATGAQLFNSNSAVLPYTPAGAQTLWQDTFVLQQNALTRQVYNADGSAEYYGVAGNDPAGLTKLTYWTANSFANPNSGYFGFGGNGMAGEYIIDNFKIGYASDSTCSDITWLLEDNFDTVDNWTVETGADRVTMGAAKYLVADNPANGAGIVYNTPFAKTEGVARLFEASLSLDVVSAEAGKAIGIAAGLGEVETCAGAPFVGVRENASGNAELIVVANGEVVQSVDLGAPLDGTAPVLTAVANVVENGVELVGKLGDKSVSHVFDSLDGKIAIAALGTEGSAVAKILELNVNSFTGVLRDGRSLSTDFESELNKNWHLVSKPSPETEGYVAVEDGKLEFELAGDGALFGTKYEYVNFELKFDILVQQLDEDEEGNITKPSTWPGISFGRENINSNFWDAGCNLIYFQTSTIDLLNFANNGRIWLAAENDMHNATNFGKSFTVRLRAYNGTVELYLLNNGIEGAQEFKAATWENVDTAGYVAICCTAGANFTIDNYSITNLDGNEATNALPVISTEITSHDVEAGQTVTGTVTATDADEDALTYVLVADNTTEYGTLTFNEDGTYTFVAKEDAATGVATFTYKATDTEDEVEGTITINVTAKPTEQPGGNEGEQPGGNEGEQPGGNEGEQPGGNEGEQPGGNEGEQPEQPAKGCLGSVTASLITISTMLGAVVVLRKKRNEK